MGQKLIENSNEPIAACIFCQNVFPQMTELLNKNEQNLQERPKSFIINGSGSHIFIFKIQCLFKDKSAFCYCRLTVLNLFSVIISLERKEPWPGN